ncbi:MAG: hypothetical protein ACLSAP_02685 [Oscillospiraceae bacterium]
MIGIAAGRFWSGFGGYPFAFALSIGIAVLVIPAFARWASKTTAIMVEPAKARRTASCFSPPKVERARTVDAVVLDKTGTVTEVS